MIGILILRGVVYYSYVNLILLLQLKVLDQHHDYRHPICSEYPIINNVSNNAMYQEWNSPARMVNDQGRLKEETLLALMENWKKILRLALRKDFTERNQMKFKHFYYFFIFFHDRYCFFSLNFYNTVYPQRRRKIKISKTREYFGP